MHPAAVFLLIAAAAGIAWLASRSRSAEAAAHVVADPWELPEPAADVAAAVPAPDVFETFAAAVNNTLQSLFRLPASAAPYADAIRAAEARYSLPDGLLGRVLYQESRFRPDIISGATRSSAGAMGIAQFMPATAADLGVDPLDPFQSIDGAARYLRQLYNMTGDWPRALAAYNWGVGNVQRKGIGAAPLETRRYVAEITADVPV